MTRYPTVLPYKGDFEVDIKYSTSITRQLVVKVLDESENNVYGLASKSIIGQGTITLKVILFGDLEEGIK